MPFDDVMGQPKRLVAYLGGNVIPDWLGNSCCWMLLTPFPMNCWIARSGSVIWGCIVQATEAGLWQAPMGNQCHLSTVTYCVLASFWLLLLQFCIGFTLCSAQTIPGYSPPVTSQIVSLTEIFSKPTIAGRLQPEALPRWQARAGKRVRIAP
jgi:hypothetical protein